MEVSVKTIAINITEFSSIYQIMLSFINKTRLLLYESGDMWDFKFHGTKMNC